MTDTSIHSDHPRESFYRLRHLLPGACVLGGVAGYINSVVLGFFHVPVSHMTGAVSRLGLDLAEKERVDVWTAAFIIVGYVLGAVLAGLLVGARRLEPGKRFGGALIIEGLSLGVATFLLLRQARLGLPVAALACGLQNAMGSSYCGLMIRTTHVTGMVSDLGMMIGHLVRHRRIDWRKFGFFLSIFLSFGAGGYLGALADLKFGPLALALPAAGCTVAGLVYGLTVHLGVSLLPEDELT
jgi:uncharacterized membrane protein YoaK (UPF0700 family)